MSSVENLASELLQLEVPQKLNGQNGKKPTKYAIVYWIQTRV